ncbi:TetR/AcrR family transcriptional regulator [Streptomyces pristinaespiralis]|uniref:Transcriptional regulator n=2 Tax=Streptomyces pristinaespiralis TaxID=38300 RepID=B5H6S3_STRE2|nr:TetR/AcrR family transcriptional regulator [Streptomyces pristinaespiralis]ALC18702.1 transcriptional regulator [Streptomyces pristinaespiralis]EDY62534.1 transcriptional regulator [Streptomyces pristinaespiralis ATCC 25486]QMU18134.1 TetR/AcrR family transcriptional regulator [Streptomyces pristinaespiralis]
MTTDTDPRPTRRPRDRKAKIVAAAVECFHRSGYHATGMEEIAKAVGITAGSLYWHFRGKQELLDQVVLDGLDMALAAVGEEEDLDAVLRSLASFSLENRAFAALWEKEAIHLSPVIRREVQERHTALAGRVSAAVRAARPGLDARDAELLAWAVLGVLAGPSYNNIELPRPVFDHLLAGLAGNVCQVEGLPPAGPPGATAPRPVLTHASRREALLSASVRLFAERGFPAVSMDDIGKAAGISGPAVYNHFASKSDLLSTALHRATGALQFDLDLTLATSASAHQALERTVRALSTVNLASGGSAGLLHAIPHLPDADREALHRAQLEYATEWTGLVRACRPDMRQTEAQIAVHCVLTLVRFLAQMPALRCRTDPAQTLVDLGLQTLGLRHDG